MKPRTIYARDLALRAQLDAKIKRLRREANDLSKQLSTLDDAILAYTKSEAGSQKSLDRSGWRLTIVPKKKGIPWKQLLLAACGRQAIDAAEAEAEVVDKIEITPISKAAQDVADAA
ncbi:MAG: hypothetical protein AAGF31_13825 [Planctomycetota bacterium]